ncbi:hypothetical protein BaRGS_00019941 [Batillaria attramentaria]|uniref:Uncharacterized protein n=1 Tax=Batillaria attramentaria TaxID=370345 RepID=A0ABD0KNT2_9CAEN
MSKPSTSAWTARGQWWWACASQKPINPQKRNTKSRIRIPAAAVLAHECRCNDNYYNVQSGLVSCHQTVGKPRTPVSCVTRMTGDRHASLLK